MMSVESVTTSGGTRVASRSKLYRLLADGFLYPDRELFESLKDGSFRNHVIAICDDLPHDLEPAFDGLVATGDYVDFQAEYLRFFEVGQGMPPCPLYAGTYQGGRKGVMEEVARFYSFFGLSIEHGTGELPDHLATELEFMHFLAFKELNALEQGKDTASYRLAQADFLERQLTSWLPALEKRLERLEPPPFYTALVWMANAFAHAELVELGRTLVRTSTIPLEQV